MVSINKSITRENWKTTIKMSSEFWHTFYIAKYGVLVLDPDGWDRKNYNKSWREKITYEEFKQRLMRSTLHPADEYVAVMTMLVNTKSKSQVKNK